MGEKWGDHLGNRKIVKETGREFQLYRDNWGEDHGGHCGDRETTEETGRQLGKWLGICFGNDGETTRGDNMGDSERIADTGRQLRKQLNMILRETGRQLVKQLRAVFRRQPGWAFRETIRESIAETGR